MSPWLRLAVVASALCSCLTRSVEAQPLVVPSARESAPTSVVARAAPDSPRASISRFRDLVRRARWTEAARYLEIPASQSLEGPRLARELSEVIDYHFGWDLDGVSGDSLGDVDDGLPPRVDELGEVPQGRGAFGAVRVQRREFSEGPRWVFTRATVLRIDDWYDRLEGRWAREHLPASLNARGPRELRWWQWAALPILCALALLFGRVIAALTRRALDRVVGRVPVARGEGVGARAVGPVTLLVASLALEPVSERL